MSTILETFEVMKARLNHLETEKIPQSLCKALSLEDCNPYDYLNRMSAQTRGDVRYVLLDGFDLLAIHPVKTEWFHDEMKCTLPMEYLWTDNKKPAV